MLTHVLDIKNPLISLFTESRDSTEWSILAQVRFRGDFNEEMSVVDADVFRFGHVQNQYIYKVLMFNFLAFNFTFLGENFQF